MTIPLIPFLFALISIILYALPSTTGKFATAMIAVFVASMTALMIAATHVSVHLG